MFVFVCVLLFVCVCIAFIFFFPFFWKLSLSTWDSLTFTQVPPIFLQLNPKSQWNTLLKTYCTCSDKYCKFNVVISVIALFHASVAADNSSYLKAPNWQHMVDRILVFSSSRVFLFQYYHRSQAMINGQLITSDRYKVQGQTRTKGHH